MLFFVNVLLKVQYAYHYQPRIYVTYSIRDKFYSISCSAFWLHKFCIPKVSLFFRSYSGLLLQFCKPFWTAEEDGGTEANLVGSH